MFARVIFENLHISPEVTIEKQESHFDTLVGLVSNVAGAFGSGRDSRCQLLGLMIHIQNGPKNSYRGRNSIHRG